MFDPLVLPFVRFAHNHCQTPPQHQHRSTSFKHSRPHHSFRLKRLFCICGSTDHPKVFQSEASIRVLHSCVVNMSSCALAEHGSGPRSCGRQRRKAAVDLATQTFLDYRPDAPSEHYQQHLDSVLDFAEKQSQFYKLQVVGT